MRRPKPIVIDFETEEILPRPDYPPEPVGVSIQRPGLAPRYYAWGHKHGGNNCTEEEARKALLQVWDHDDGLLFHHAKFDLDVAETHLGLALPEWRRVHDTAFLIFLEDPRLFSFELKPCAQHFLGIQSDERDELKEWILDKANKAWIESHLGTDPETGKRRTVKPSQWGAFISYAPGKIAGRYANGDVFRTGRLFDHLWKRVVVERGMGQAYDRERRLMPHLLRSEREGTRVDASRLRKDIVSYQGLLQRIDDRIRKKCRRDINVDSAEELAEALVDAGLADEGLMGYTKTGKLQTNKNAIKEGVTDLETKALILYRGPLTTCLSTFMLPWLATAEKSGGLLFTSWNQTKHGDGKNKIGTSTGRLSSTPNFQNVPKEFPPLAYRSKNEPGLLGVTPAQLRTLTNRLKLSVMPPLPLCRGYIVPYTPDDVLFDRDYSQQELRILGHYEDGVLLQAYLQDLWLDMHEHARQLIKKITGRLYERKPVKNTNFGIIYGQGASSLAVKNDTSYQEAKDIIDAVLDAFPGIQDLMDDMKDRAEAEEPIRTWGGREYYCEPPKFVEKFQRVMAFDYKLINLLVQGSAADCTKEGLIRWCDAKPPEDRFLMTVHDETLGSTPRGRLQPAMELMREAMESVEFDVPILTEGSWSPQDWAHMKDYDKAGKVVYIGR